MAETFPVKRFTRITTKEERDQLTREFERSDLGVQQSIVEHFKSQSVSGLRDYVANLRDIGHFSDSPQSPEKAPEDDFEDVKTTGVNESASAAKSHTPGTADDDEPTDNTE
jgi:hypothetical protein